MILPLPLPLALSLSQVILYLPCIYPYLPYISPISPPYLPISPLSQVIRVNHAPVAHSAAGRRYAWLG